MKVSTEMERAIKQIAQKHSINLTQPHSFLKLQMRGYTPLAIHNMGENRLRVMHITSDQRMDPEIVFWTGSSAGWAPIEVLQLIGSRRVYVELDETATLITAINERKQADLNDFAEMWAGNIVDQQWLEYGDKTHELFPLGKIVATPGAVKMLEEREMTAQTFIHRHVRGDWGVLPAEDIKENQDSLVRGGRLFSAYPLTKGGQLWVITEWDRSSTTVLLPSEY